MDQNQGNGHHPCDYTVENFTPSELSAGLILSHCSDKILTDKIHYLEIQPVAIAINTASFIIPGVAPLEVTLEDNRLTLSCFCNTPKKRLCEHQAGVLFSMLRRHEIRMFFDKNKRQEKFKQEAAHYGLEQEKDLDDYFQLKYENGSVEVTPKLKELFPVHKRSVQDLKNHVISSNDAHLAKAEDVSGILVFGQHKYYKNLTVDLFEAQRTQTGKHGF